MALEFLKPIIRLLPEVKAPDRAPPLREKIYWTAAVLIIFFVMYHIYPIGRYPIQEGFNFVQMITASRIGSLITAGIGPIVLASIFLQLFIGSKIIEMDLNDKEQKRIFQGAQKLLAIILSFFEAAIYVYTKAVPVMGVGVPAGNVIPFFGSLFMTEIFVILQLAMGSIILLYLDEIVAKYGIGSGISLFIAAGVSLAVVQGTFGVLIPSAMGYLAEGGATAVPLAILAMLPLAFAFIVFITCSYAEGMRVEVPLVFERVRGVGGRYPIKFLYVSNIPVILAAALMMNFQLIARTIGTSSFYIGGVNIVSFIAVVDSSGRLSDGLLYFMTPSFPNPVVAGYGTYVDFLLHSSTQFFYIPEFFHVIAYILSMVILCVIFGTFWIETTGMGAADIAAQLKDSGLLVPGFRRDPRVIEKVLDKYIPMITILGSIFVGLLAAFADLTGALGTGTGILLTVSILNNMYETLKREQMFETYPALRNLVG
ncbi:MAG: Protein translocase subunit SecY [Candidatus Fermentimicrarchaeum limneticum]|uniref:Protein translocase subunit SecY n=1 Tax=Fermentimicrarchaeum limneticum TaxID=2795018 RepID=A0A7D6BH35_FERL1|nr:MAG: Protein translocase subunit SecY [Candidatus Fermentimicrarchaeum limneticum]